MIVGAIGLIYGFIAAPSTLEEVEEMMAAEAHHGGGHGEEASHETTTHDIETIHNASEQTHSETATGDNHEADSHEVSHAEHVFHQLQNKPWAAVYVAAFFFMMIALGVLAI